MASVEQTVSSDYYRQVPALNRKRSKTKKKYLVDSDDDEVDSDDPTGIFAERAAAKGEEAIESERREVTYAKFTLVKSLLLRFAAWRTFSGAR